MIKLNDRSTMNRKKPFGMQTAVPMLEVMVFFPTDRSKEETIICRNRTDSGRNKAEIPDGDCSGRYQQPEHLKG